MMPPGYIHVLRNCVTKTAILGGSYDIYICVFLNPLQIFVPFVKIIFFMNRYFIVCIFKYRTSSREFH